MFLMSRCRGKRNKSSVETQLIFSLSKALATCFELNQSIIRPLYKTNSRYNVMTCQHNVHSLCSFVESHITVIIEIVRVRFPLLSFVESWNKAFRYISQWLYFTIYIYTGCPRRNVPDFGRVFLMLKYTDITQNTNIQS